MDFRTGYRRPLRTASLLRKKRLRTRLWLCALAATVATVAACSWDAGPADKVATQAAAPTLKISLNGTTPPAAQPARRIYPYSVIPGGVGSRDDIARRVASDHVVAAHYASFDVKKAHPVTNTKARAVHVSYRNGDKIYWTKGKVMLAQGETLLSDGTSEIRGRCGNRISEAAMLPVAMGEPTAAELDESMNVAPGAEDDGGLQNASFDLDSALPGGSAVQGRSFPGGLSADAAPVSPGARSGMPSMPTVAQNGMGLTPSQFLAVSSGPALALGPSTEGAFTVSPATTEATTPPADTLSTPADTPTASVPPVAVTTPVVPQTVVTTTPPGTPGTPGTAGMPATPVAEPKAPVKVLPEADVPEPATLWLFGTAFALLVLRRRSRK